MTLTVLEAGPLSSVQDPAGRPGWRRFGVPVGGAADAWSARLANRLVGNPDGAALIEVTLGGASFGVEGSSMIVAVTGGLEAWLDQRPGAPAAAVEVAPGARLRLDHGDGARGYLAVAGGVDVELVLGSRSTELRSGFGGHAGRALAAGDRLPTGPAVPRRSRWTGTRHAGPIRVMPGPHPAAFAALVAQAWTVSVAADRAGVRLDGGELDPGVAEVPSMGLPLGAVQVTPDGRPIVMLADRPVTGGYPVPAVVIRADIGRVAQLLPGDGLRFAPVSMADAHAAWGEAEASLDRLAAVDG